MDFLTQTTHLHITTWVVALILFAVAAFSSKQMKGVHMALRAMYILVIISGGALFMEWRGVVQDGGMNYDMKVLFGILVIGFMEMVLVRKGKGKPVKTFAILLAIALLVTIYLGLSMGISMNF